MLQLSGPANTPCSGWQIRNHVQSPSGRPLDLPDRQNRSFRCDKSAASPRRIVPRARNRIFAARDQEAKSDFLARQRPVAASHASQEARKCGLLSQSLRECEITRMRGGGYSLLQTGLKEFHLLFGFENSKLCPITGARHDFFNYFGGLSERAGSPYLIISGS
jgi:hypothetical protein